MGRALLGLLKGLLVGGAVGFGLLYLGQGTGFLAYLGCALTGALVGLLCGRAPWKAETIWTPALKTIFGMGVGAGLFALGRHFLPAMKFSLQGLPGELALNQATLLAPAIGVVYGLFVEVDDGGTNDKESRDKERRALGV